MMNTKRLLIYLKPLEPYFLGGEKTFHQLTSKGKQRYFIESEKYPNQTAIFGVLRYLGIKEKSSKFHLKQEDKLNIGEASYNILRFKEEGQSFGKIRGISPMFFISDSGEFFVKSPMDHQTEEEDQGYKSIIENQDSMENILTNKGQKKIPKYYNGKIGVHEGIISLNDYKVHDEPFSTIIRIGINKEKKDQSYFKKAYKFLENHSFAFFATVDETFPEIKDSIVYLGQQKSPFGVKVVEENGTCSITGKNGVKLHDIWEEQLKGLSLKMDNRCMALSDLFLEKNQILEQYVDFSIMEKSTQRVFKTKYGSEKNPYEKGSETLQLIKAGSVFLIKPDLIKDFKGLVRNKHLSVAGLNYLIGGDE